MDSRPRWQLPADVSGFVGRSGELTRLAELLTVARLVTVAGTGGVGKTRLALRAAAGLGRGHGACLVDLSGLTDPGLLAETLALRLDGNQAGPAGGLPALLRDLGGRELLLILDTCEHLAGACARLVTDILRETSGVTILATSRQPLHVPGEEVLRLGPLPVPGDAVELFAQRAAAAASGFALTDENRPHVVRLCRRLDGIPLAIELAAVRVRSLPLTELTERLDAGLTASTGTRRGTHRRHQTLRAAIEWSHGLCTAAEQAAWRRLAVFADTFDLAVAADVTGDAAALSGLIDKSVVLPAGAGRYRLPGTVREFGAQQLAAAGEATTGADRHLARYLRLASDFGRRLVADGQRQRLSQLRAEHANIRAALEHGLSRNTAGDAGAGNEPGPARARAAARLAAVLVPYWGMSGLIREGMHWQDKVLDRFAAPSPERASAMTNRALLSTAAGVADGAETVRRASEAVALSAEAGDELAIARAHVALQFALTVAGRSAEALEAAKTARRQLETLGAEQALRTLDMQLALTYVHARHFDAAIEQCQRLLRGLSPGERWLRGNGQALLALAYYGQPGRPAEAAGAATAALRSAQEIGNLVGEAYSLEVLGWLAADGGRGQRAAWLLGAAQALWERTGGRLSGSTALDGYHDRAAATAERALGTTRYQELHAAGSTRPVRQIAALALAGADVLPEPADPGNARCELDWVGDEGLTSREREIAGLVARGLSSREIAARLVISKRTVDAHVNHIFAKLGLSSRVQLTIWLRNREPARDADELSPAAGG